MLRLPALLLVVYISLPVDAVLTNFHFYGSIYCPLDLAMSTDFVSEVKVYEGDFLIVNWLDDDIGLDDTLKLTRSYENETNPMMRKITKYQIDAQDTGDWPSNEYEVYIAVKHNCNPGREKRWEYEFVLPYIKVQDGHVYMKHDMRLTDTSGRKKRNLREGN